MEFLFLRHRHPRTSWRTSFSSQMYPSFAMLAPESGLTSGGPSKRCGGRVKIVSGHCIKPTYRLQSNKFQGSEASIRIEYPVDEAISFSSKEVSNKSKSNGQVEGPITQPKRAKGVSTRGLVRKLKHFSPISNNTVVLRNRQGRYRHSLHDLARVHSAPSNAVGNLPLSDEITVENDTGRKPIVEPSLTIIKDTPLRPNGR